MPPRCAGCRRPERRPAPPDVPSLPALMRTLYADARLGSGELAAILGMPERTVREQLRRYAIKARTRGGCGVGVHHIELLTGQASESVRGFMHRAGIPLRHPGGRTPFLRRWRSGQADSGRRGLPGGPRREPSAAGSAPAGEASRAKRAAPQKKEMFNDDIR